MFCKKCGSEIKDSAMFCTNCGAKQNADAAVPVQNTTPDTEKTIGSIDANLGTKATQSAVEPQIVQQPKAEPAVAPAQPSEYQAPVQIQNAGETSNGKVGFIKAISLYFKNCINFSGRASKSEYWWAFLFNVIMVFPLGSISNVSPQLSVFCSIVLMLPGISLAVRRLHDVGKPGIWWFMGLIPIAGAIILLLQFLKDSECDNQWGPGPVAPIYGSGQFVDIPVTNLSNVNNATNAQRDVTDNEFYAMAQNHVPVNVNTPDAKKMMDSAIGRIIPTYTGIEDLAEAMMLCDPQSIKANIAATDTDTLFVIFKALGFYIGQGGDADVIGMVQQNVLATLKTRF